MAHIAFIGLGKMGRPMAANLVRAGYDVRGFDLLPMSRDDAAKEGVSIATSAKETLEGAERRCEIPPCHGGLWKARFHALLTVFGIFAAELYWITH